MLWESRFDGRRAPAKSFSALCDRIEAGETRHALLILQPLSSRAKTRRDIGIVNAILYAVLIEKASIELFLNCRYLDLTCGLSDFVRPDIRLNPCRLHVAIVDRRVSNFPLP
jgi:hypothetical protein